MSETSDSSSSGLPVRRLIFQLYLPWTCSQLGRGMMLPILPLYLREIGMSYSMTAVVLAAVGVGAVVGGLPAGAVASRRGPDVLFAIAVVVLAITSAAVGLTEAAFALVLIQFMAGPGSVGLTIATQTILTNEVPVAVRGRSMAAVGGTVRFAFFVGPIVGGLLAQIAGFTVAFIACGVVNLAGLLPFMLSRPSVAGGRRLNRPTTVSGGMRHALRRHAALLVLAGVGPALITTVRSGRNVVVPLVGDEIGLSTAAVGVLVAIGTGAELLLFPVSGWLMDRFGRLASIVPAFGLLGVGMLLLGLAGSSTPPIVFAGVVMGLGNGMSAGTMLTLGGDLAPAADPGPFLAALGVMQGLGYVFGPLIVGWLADVAGLAAAAVVLAMVMFAGITWIVVALGNTAQPSRPWLTRRLDGAT